MCSLAWLSSVLLNVIPTVPASMIVTFPVSSTASWNVTPPVEVVMSVSTSVVPAASVVRPSMGLDPPTSPLKRVVPAALTVRFEVVRTTPSSSIASKNVTSLPAVIVTSSVNRTSSRNRMSVPANWFEQTKIRSFASTSIVPEVATITPSITMSAFVVGVRPGPTPMTLPVSVMLPPAWTCVKIPSMSIRMLSNSVSEPIGSERNVVAKMSEPVVVTSRPAVSRAS